MGLKQLLLLWRIVDLEVIAKKKYFTLQKHKELEAHH